MKKGKKGTHKEEGKRTMEGQIKRYKEGEYAKSRNYPGGGRGKYRDCVVAGGKFVWKGGWKGGDEGADLEKD